ncbi:TIGR01777 family oxidoreductase [Flaviflexus massiliensis]|uniref:TIGR01777 family oxidoreductase n=1 Tax=Flaviflexus massiliensis TaxID=1522309 RepID=UPI0006D56323|nr:TIGR01777 family oxidoreductase [Flaviflexus massiliensis]
MRLVVSGASGFLGSALVTGAEEAGWSVATLSRGTNAHETPNFDPGNGWVDEKVLAGADAVVCLNGAGLFSRPWTASYKANLLSSRLSSVKTLIDGIGRLNPHERPSHFVTGSAIGYYGANRGDRVLDETDSPGDDFLADLCVQWEAAGREVEKLGVTHSALRTGLVMDGRGGMLGLLKHLYRFGLGTRLGDGQQWMSTISLRDHVRATLHVIEHELAGPVNLTSPNPLRNRQWHELLAKHLHRPAFLVAPRPVLTLALGDFAKQAAFASQRVLPDKLVGSGFEFWDPTVADIFTQALPSK